MSVSDYKKNCGTHRDSSFMLGRLRPSSENPLDLSRGSVKYIDLAAAKALIRRRGVLEGYSATERENDVCDMLDEVPGVELPCKVGDVLYRAFPGLLSTNHVGTIIPVVVEQIVLRKQESEIIASNRTYYFSEVGKILFKTKKEAERALMEGTK